MLDNIKVIDLFGANFVTRYLADFIILVGVIAECDYLAVQIVINMVAYGFLFVYVKNINA